MHYKIWSHHVLTMVLYYVYVKMFHDLPHSVFFFLFWKKICVYNSAFEIHGFFFWYMTFCRQKYLALFWKHVYLNLSLNKLLHILFYLIQKKVFHMKHKTEIIYAFVVFYGKIAYFKRKPTFIISANFPLFAKKKE